MKYAQHLIAMYTVPLIPPRKPSNTTKPSRVPNSSSTISACSTSSRNHTQIKSSQAKTLNCPTNDSKINAS